MSGVKFNQLRTKFPTMVTWLILTLFISMTIGQMASAYLVNGGPTTSAFGYVVSKTSDVTILQTSVGVYYDTNTAHTITIQNAQLCDFGTSSGDTENMGDLATAAKGTAFNTFTAYKADANEGISTNLDSKTATVLKRASDPASDCTNDDLTLTINANELTRSAKTGKFVAIIRATILGSAPSNNQNTFRISAPGALVGVIGANSSVATSVSGSQAGYNFNPSGTYPRKNGSQDIYFGTPCDVPNPQTAFVHIYDVDNSNSGIQKGDITMDVYDLTDGKLLPAISRSYFDTTATPNIYSPQDKTSAGSSYATLGFPAAPNHKYRLDVNNIDNFNTIQLTLPYNSIYADINCDNVTPELDPSVTLNPANGGPTVAIGESITGTFAVSEVNKVNNGIADYARYMWVENGNDSVYTPGVDTLLHTMSGSNYNFTAGGTTSVTVPPGGYTVTGGNQICGSYQLTAKNTPNGMTQIVPPNPEVVCIPIAKSPKIQVSGGDVWVGGKTSSPCAVLPASARIVGVDDSNGDQNASFGELAVTALGGISGFGSRNDPYGGTFGKTLTFAYNPSTGTFMGSGIPSHCLSDPFSTFASIPKTAGAATLGATTLGAGGTLYRYYSGDVTINGDITYNDTPYAIGQFPQTVIMTDGNIIVNPGVKQLDGLYIAKGQIRTCDATPSSKTDCNQKLTINGAVYTGTNLKPWRTAGAEGAGGAINDKAEVINLRPDFYYGECGRVCGDGIQTMSEQEAPVRF